MGENKKQRRGLEGRVTLYFTKDTSDELVKWVNLQKNKSAAILNVLEMYVNKELIPIDIVTKMIETKEGNDVNVTNQIEETAYLNRMNEHSRVGVLNEEIAETSKLSDKPINDLTNDEKEDMFLNLDDDLGFKNDGKSIFSNTKTDFRENKTQVDNNSNSKPRDLNPKKRTRIAIGYTRGDSSKEIIT